MDQKSETSEQSPAAEIVLTPEIQRGFLEAYRTDFQKQRSLYQQPTIPANEMSELVGKVAVWEQVLVGMGLNSEVAKIRKEEQDKINSRE